MFYPFGTPGVIKVIEQITKCQCVKGDESYETVTTIVVHALAGGVVLGGAAAVVREYVVTVPMITTI